MTLKASVSISDSQNAFARDLVARGRFSSLSAVVQQGLELLRAQTEREEAELEALRAFFRDRRDGAFEDAGVARAATEAMIAARRADHGL
ncbi:MAG: type II toxin-antitoxin system ParD family antitoxin [Rubrimonas sp.]